MVEEKTDGIGTEEGTEVSFEDALSQLEDVIHRMETGGTFSRSEYPLID